MLDEGVLRERMPEIPWDQPVKISLIGFGPGRWACRYCIALHGLRGWEVFDAAFVFDSREETLSHIERDHHD